MQLVLSHLTLLHFSAQRFLELIVSPQTSHEHEILCPYHTKKNTICIVLKLCLPHMRHEILRCETRCSRNVPEPELSLSLSAINAPFAPLVK